MKCLVITSLLLLSASSWSKDSLLLRCLGKEEKSFHLKKDLGPLYDLNQRMIAEMIQIPNAEVNHEVYQEVCVRTTGSNALKLLQISINQGKNIFVVPKNLEEMQRQITLGMIEDYSESTKEIFLNFLAQIQTSAPTPNCLKEEIPDLANFLIDVKYLQEDVDIKKIFRGRDKGIFERLKNYSAFFERCRSRLKKKPKPSSTPADKKS